MPAQNPLFDEELAPEPENDVAEVWAEYQTLIPSGKRFALTDKRRRIIRKALEVRSKADCLAAIGGLAASRFHNGENDRGKKYLDIRYALQGIGSEDDDERIDKAATWVKRTVTDFLADLPSGVRDMVRDRQKKVERMLLNPDDQNLRARAEDSEQYLRERFGLVAHVEEGRVTWQRHN